MPKLTIDNREVDVPEGTTLLEAARKLGIQIPTLCYMPGLPAATSCMVCVVRNVRTDKLVPSCATVASENLVIESDSENVHAARRSALELLLSEHLGDCEAPCHRICPAHMDIPTMIRQIAAGDLAAAIRTVKADIALPAVLGRICPELCERGCRRKEADKAVSICLLKRYAADVDLASADPYLPEKLPTSGKKVAIVGAGPAGLAAAWYTLIGGHAVTLLEENEQPGGQLRAIDPQRLQPEALDAEIDLVRKLGAEIRTGQKLGDSLSVEQLRTDFDAVILALGHIEADELKSLGLPSASRGIEADLNTLATPIDGLFAAGAVIRPINKQAVRAVADGKHAAFAVNAYLAGEPLPKITKPLSVNIGKLREGEPERFMKLASDAPRQEPAAPNDPLDSNQALTEAERCLHCDCRKPHTCKLRIFAEQYGAATNVYHTERPDFQQNLEHPEVIYEPGKCIYCGLCVRITEQEGEEFGLNFVGRGFRVKVAVPMNRSMVQALSRTAHKVVDACPTGALAFRDNLPAGTPTE